MRRQTLGPWIMSGAVLNSLGQQSTQQARLDDLNLTLDEKKNCLEKAGIS